MNPTDRPTLGAMVEQFFALKAEKKSHDEAALECSRAIEELQQAIIAECDAQNVTGTSSKLGNVKITESVIPHVTDWEAYGEFIYANRYLHLMERRPSLTGCRELFSQGATIPGVVPFVKRVLKPSKAA